MKNLSTKKTFLSNISRHLMNVTSKFWQWLKKRFYREVLTERQFWQAYELGRKNFSFTRLLNVNLGSVELKHLNLQKADLRSCYFPKSLSLARLNLTGVILSGIDLSDRNLQGAILSKAVLNSVNLAGANLDRTNLSQANLHRSNLEQSSLSKANLTRAKLSGANLYICIERT